jgi:hypothetical protein
MSFVKLTTALQERGRPRFACEALSRDIDFKGPIDRAFTFEEHLRPA